VCVVRYRSQRRSDPLSRGAFKCDHVQKQLFISCAKATLHLMCKSNSSSHVQKQLFISRAKATLHLVCKSNCSSHVQKQLFISCAKATIHLTCKSNSSSHVQKQLFISCAKATLHLMGKSNSSSHGQKQLFIYKSRHKRSDLERNMARNKKKAAKSLEVLISSLWQNLDIRFDQHLYLPLHTLLSQLHDHPLSHVALHRS